MIHPSSECGQHLRILGYQWRVLRFNDDTRQSAVKVMAAYQETKPETVYFMQQPHCLAVPCTFFTISNPKLKKKKKKTYSKDISFVDIFND